MRNLWGKLSKPSSLGSTGPVDQQITLQQSQAKPIVIDYFGIRQIQQKILKFDAIDMFQFPNSKVATTFQEIMSTLHNLLDILGHIRQEVQKNNQKLTQYDRLKNLVSQQSQIVKNIQEQSSHSLNRLYEEKRRIEKESEQKIQKLDQKLLEQTQQLKRMRSQLQKLNVQNQGLKMLLSQKNTQIEKLSQRQDLYNKKVNQILAIDDNPSPFQSKTYNMGDVVDIQVILVYSKLRKRVYSFLLPAQFVNLSLCNKHIHYICNKTLKKQYISIMVANKNSEIESLKKDKKDNQKIIDSFPVDNIRTNAIKYLFFKIKPGGYMLPYFQDEEHQPQKIQQKSKLSQISSFFKKKNQPETNKQKLLTFQSLKNDHDFKQIQKKVQTFFDKIFGIQAQDDLKIFSQTMKKQLNQLKTQLKGSQKSLQLLCMSRFLYLQMNELNNLLQVCFALLINKHNDIKQLKKKNEDLVENDRVLRNLVQSIANDRQQVEKRIFYLQNQNLKSKHSQQIIQQQLKKIKKNETNKKQQNQRLLLQIKDLMVKVEDYEKQNKQNKAKWNQVAQLIDEIKIQDFP